MEPILFVCTSNFCRSPLAASLFNKHALSFGLDRQLTAQSRGAFSGKEPRPAERRTRELALKHGIDLAQHRTADVVPEDLTRFSSVVVMDMASYEYLKDLEGKTPRTRIRRFVELFGDLALNEIADPVMGEAEFETTFAMIDKGVKALLRELIRAHGLPLSEEGKQSLQ